MFVVDKAEFKATLTPEGYLSGEAIATRTGVFTYHMPDGSVQRQLRHPDDVLNQDSLLTLRLKPVTDEHPLEMLNVDNAQKYSVGFTGDNVRVDGGNVGITFSVTNKDTILKVVGKKARELSLGYNLDLIDEAGIFEGEAYTHRQTNIRYNHLAIVPKGRAGSVARINMDGAAVQLHHDHVEDTTMEKPTTTVQLDGIDYPEVPKEVANALNKAHASLAEAQVNADAMQAKTDEAKASLEKYSAEFNADSIETAVSKRLALMAEASKVINVDDMMGKTDRQIQEAAIHFKHKDMNLDGLSNDYVTARFHAVIEAVPSKEDQALASQRVAVANATNKDAAPDANQDLRHILNKQNHGGVA